VVYFIELIDVIRGRKSIRRFKGKPVPMELVREALDAANYAPSAKRGEQWRFTVLTGGSKDAFVAFFNAELDKFIAEHGVKEAGSSKNSRRIMGEAPVLVVVWNSGEHGWITEEHSVAAAIQNILLRACDLGLGSLWIGDVYYAYDAIQGYFGKGWKLSGAVSLGYADGEGAGFTRKTVDEVTEFLV
jgi:nitroreductase